MALRMPYPQEEANELQDKEPLIKPELLSVALKRPDATTKATPLSSKDNIKESNSCGCVSTLCERLFHQIKSVLD